MACVVVLVTARNAAQARKIARGLVAKRLAACCNILPKIQSIYRWEGKVCEEPESLLIVKTSRKMFPALKKEVKALHSYSVPEIIALPIVAGDAAYLQWLASVLGNPKALR